MSLLLLCSFNWGSAEGVRGSLVDAQLSDSDSSTGNTNNGNNKMPRVTDEDVHFVCGVCDGNSLAA
jgi:hypothetical protein